VTLDAVNENICFRSYYVLSLLRKNIMSLSRTSNITEKEQALALDFGEEELSSKLCR